MSDHIFAQLAQSDAALRATLAGLSEAQWNWKPDAAVWSIGEIAEHLVLVERGILFRLRTAPPDGIEKTEGKEQVSHHAADRTVKLPAPPRLHPTGKFADAPACLEGLGEARANLLAWAQDPATHLRQHVMPHPAFGELHGEQWLELIASHTLRHLDQIRELQAQAGYPQA
jgi:hypothetical protein